MSMERFTPEIEGHLRRHRVNVPECILQATGIRIFGRLVRSLVFSTDVALIKNCNADAVIAVYPFTPQPVITSAILGASDAPVFCGIGGGVTTGRRVLELAMDAEFKGAMGVVVNAPTPDETISLLREKIDIPVVVTVVCETCDFRARIEAGANILNVSGAARTPAIIRRIRDEFPDLPIIATGGPTEDSILETIDAGANAITWTPPTSAELFRCIMDRYREEGI